MAILFKLRRRCNGLPSAAVNEFIADHQGQTESIIEFAIGSNPASNVTLEPWNSSFRRRPKSNRNGLFLGSPAGWRGSFLVVMTVFH
jgi:hypothetical protein